MCFFERTTFLSVIHLFLCIFNCLFCCPLTFLFCSFKGNQTVLIGAAVVRNACKSLKKHNGFSAEFSLHSLKLKNTKCFCHNILTSVLLCSSIHEPKCNSSLEVEHSDDITAVNGAHWWQPLGPRVWRQAAPD